MGDTLNNPDSRPGGSSHYFSSTNPDINWQQVDVEFDFVSHTYDFKLNGVSAPWASNIPFNGDAATVSSIQQIMFYNMYNNNSRFAIDDITISTVAIPEPASVASLAIVGLMLRRKR